MKIALLFLCFWFTSNWLYPQIDFKKVTVGLSAKFLMPHGDMGEFWQKSPGAGAVIGYNIENYFSLESELAYSRISSKNDNPDYPLIHFVELSGGIKYKYLVKENISISLKPGLQNCMFIFSGTAADEIYEQNKNESEFGFFLSAGLMFNFGSGISLEFNYRVLSILSSPENINIYIPGITLFIL